MVFSLIADAAEVHGQERHHGISCGSRPKSACYAEPFVDSYAGVKRSVPLNVGQVEICVVHCNLPYGTRHRNEQLSA